MSEQAYELKSGQTVLVGTVASVETKGYGSAGKTMTIIRLDTEGYEGRAVPYEVKAFKAAFGATKGEKVELLCRVNGSAGNGAHEGRIFLDLTLIDFKFVGKQDARTESGTVEVPADKPTDDANLPF